MRNPYISFLQAFGILLVVVGHAFPTDGQDNIVWEWIYSFHMPLWVFISGYLLRYTAPLTITQDTSPLAAIRLGGRGGFVDRKARRLLVPYLLISTLVFIPKVWLSDWAVKPVELSWDAYFEMLLIPSRNVIVYYWFIPTIFILLVGAVQRDKMLSRHKLGARIPLWTWSLLTLILSVINPLESVEWFNLGGVVKLGFFFTLGIAYRSYEAHINRTLNMGMLWTTLGWGVTSVVVVVMGYGSQNALFSQLVAVSGILFVLSLGRTYLGAGFKFLEPLDGATYAIFLFSWFAQSGLRVLIYDYGDMNPWVGVPLSTAAGVILPLLLYRWLQYGKRNRAGRVVAELLGQ